MTTFEITCGGPGPHIPSNGVLGTSDRASSADVRCSSAACVKPADPKAVNKASLEDKAAQALAGNQAFLNLASPNSTQNANQIKALTRQVNALIRLRRDDLLDDVTGT